MRYFYFLFFIFFNICVFFFDLIIFIPYIFFFYFYLLSPIYYLILIIFSYLRIIMPILLVYFLLSYNYKGYKEITFFGLSRILIKEHIFNFKIKFYYKEKFCYYFYYSFLGLIIYLFLNELFFLGLLIFGLSILIIYFKLVKNIFNYSIWKINLILNFIIYVLFFLYFHLLLIWSSTFELNYNIDNVLWEIHWFKLCYRYISENWTYLQNLYEDEEDVFLIKILSLLKIFNNLDQIQTIKFLQHKFIYSSFFEIYLSFLNASNKYLDQIFYIFDTKNLIMDYDQLDLHINLNRVNKIIKNIQDASFELNTNLELYSLYEDIGNCFLYKNKFNYLNLNNSFNLKKLKYSTDFYYYMRVLWDEMQQSQFYLPLGIDYPIEYSLYKLAKRDKINLNLLLSKSLYKMNFNYEYFIDKILWNKYKNVSNKKWDQYFTLYYKWNNNLIQINLEIFFLDYLKKLKLYNNNNYLVYNEIFLMDYLLIYYNSNYEMNFLISNIESSIRDTANIILDNYIKESSNLWDWSLSLEYQTNKLKVNDFLQWNDNLKEKYFLDELQIFENEEFESWNIFQEKLRRYHFVEEGINLEYSFYIRKYLIPSNLLLQQYWINEFNQYDIDYNSFYYANLTKE